MKLRMAGALLVMSIAGNGAMLPRPATDFAINLPGNKQIHISQYKGKTVVLAFILTYCTHCQSAIRALGNVQNEFGARGVQVLATATEDTAAAALPEFLRKFAPPFPVGFNKAGDFMSFMQHSPMLVPYMPALMFIDKDGIIRAQYEGRDPFLNEAATETNIRAKLEELLAPGAGKKKSK
jgi:peroxiredoxin